MTAPLAFAEIKAKSLECQVSYTWPKGDSGLNREQLPKVFQKLTPHRELQRLVAQATQATSDGRYEITMLGMQPLKGDITEFEQLQIEVFDKRTKTYLFPMGLGIQNLENRSHAEIVLMPESKDDKPAYGIHVTCALQ